MVILYAIISVIIMKPSNSTEMSSATGLIIKVIAAVTVTMRKARARAWVVGMVGCECLCVRLFVCDIYIEIIHHTACTNSHVIIFTFSYQYFYALFSSASSCFLFSTRRAYGRVKSPAFRLLQRLLQDNLHAQQLGVIRRTIPKV